MGRVRMNEDTDHGFIKRICYDDDGKDTGIPSEELASQEKGQSYFQQQAIGYTNADGFRFQLIWILPISSGTDHAK